MRKAAIGVLVVLLVILTSIAAYYYGFAAKPAEELTVRIGAIKALGVGQIYVAMAKNWLSDAGIKYTYQEFASGPG